MYCNASTAWIIADDLSVYKNRIAGSVRLPVIGHMHRTLSNSCVARSVRNDVGDEFFVVIRVNEKAKTEFGGLI
jgi:hypothetical protein